MLRHTSTRRQVDATRRKDCATRQCNNLFCVTPGEILVGNRSLSLGSVARIQTGLDSVAAENDFHKKFTVLHEADCCSDVFQCFCRSDLLGDSMQGAPS